MAVETLEKLRAEVERNKAVDQSAIALLNGIVARIEAAVAAALAGGATSAQVAEMKALATSLGEDTNALAAAVEANTPAA
jgi:hypothetical protein